MYVSIFPILAFDDPTKNFVDNGTGFFINSEGFFISAGHVFKNKNRKYSARIHNQLYPIELVYEEYIEQDRQEKPIYKDLYIGKISFDSKQIKPLSFSLTKAKNSEYFACGYSSRIPINNQKIKKQEDLCFDDCEMEIKQLNYHKLQFKYYGEKMFQTLGIEIHWFDNGFVIEMNNTPASGLSGGPVIHDLFVKGILIAMNNCISSDYITSVLSVYSIDYKISEQ